MQLRDFDVNLLITMEAIWTTRNVSNAAKTLNLAQSTVSAALNRLRLALGDELFSWSGSEMVPTALAEQIMPDGSVRVKAPLADLRGLARSGGCLARASPPAHSVISTLHPR